MAYSKVQFPAEANCVSQGRNGNIQTLGLDVSASLAFNIVTLTPINSKGNLANCYIEVPAAQIQEVIDALQAAQKELSK